MRLYDRIGERPELLRKVGTTARTRARQAGVAAYYEDTHLGEGIVEELPDGTRRLIGRADREIICAPTPVQLRRRFR